jgi:hypothetical protein
MWRLEQIGSESGYLTFVSHLVNAGGWSYTPESSSIKVQRSTFNCGEGGGGGGEWLLVGKSLV